MREVHIIQYATYVNAAVQVGGKEREEIWWRGGGSLYVYPLSMDIVVGAALMSHNYVNSKAHS